MNLRFTQFWKFLARVYSLCRPYGKKKLAFVFLVILAQGVLQVVGVTSIFPFLGVAAQPATFRESGFGSAVLSYFPPLSDSQMLLLAGVFALAMLLVSNLFMLGGEVIRARYTHGFAHWLRLSLVRRMISNPYSYFLQRNTGELMKKAGGDVSAYVGGILAPLLEALARFITVVFLLVTLIAFNPVLALTAAFVFVGFYLLIYWFLKARREHISDQMKEANRGTFRELAQLLSGIKPVKVHGAEEPFLERYALHSFTQACLQKWFPVLNNTPRYLIEPLAFGGIVAFVMILAAQGKDFTSQLPMLGVMAFAGYRLIPNFQLLYGAASGISLSMHSLEEVYEEFHLENLDDGQRSSSTLQRYTKGLPWEESITFDAVRFTYTGAHKPVIHDVSLTIHKNQFVAFIGETGSGKSTLIDILLGLHWPQSGGILLDGKPLEFDMLRQWRAGIGYVPQEIFLRDESIAANIAFGIDPRHVDMDQVRRVAEVAQIRQFVETELAHGFDSRVGERGVRLSGGQRQRIGLARALYHKPSLLVLDEATSALDNATEAALMRALDALYGRMTVLVIAHRLTTVEKADCIFRLNNGCLVESGTYEELRL